MFTPRTAPIESIKWDGEGHVVIVHDGWTWAGSQRKDFFGADEDWESRLVPGALLRFWTISFSRVIGIEWWDGEWLPDLSNDGRGAVPLRGHGQWRSVWVCGNDFPSMAKREASAKAYGDFIQAEGEKIAGLIDQGHTLEEIDELIDRGHSVNTYGWALHLGIKNATNRENAERVRVAHNVKYGAPADATGTVNPAVLTIRVEDKAQGRADD